MTARSAQPVAGQSHKSEVCVQVQRKVKANVTLGRQNNSSSSLLWETKQTSERLETQHKNKGARHARHCPVASATAASNARSVQSASSSV